VQRPHAAETGETLKLHSASEGIARSLNFHLRSYQRGGCGESPLPSSYLSFTQTSGTATVIGMIPVGHKVQLDGPMFLTERKIQGTMMGSNRFRIDMPRYIDYYLQGRLNLDDMISRRGKLEDVNEAFPAMKAGEVARTVSSKYGRTRNIPQSQ